MQVKCPIPYFIAAHFRVMACNAEMIGKGRRGIMFLELNFERHLSVQGGDNPGNRNSYHPFYITDHPEGGYGLKVRAEQRLENIYAGVENLTMTPVGKGPRCEFMPKGGADKVEPY